MRRWFLVLALAFAGSGLLLAQQEGDEAQAPPSGPGPNQPLPHSSAPAPSAGESSSRQTIIDLSPPANDAKDHPESAGDTGDTSSDVQEFHPYDPHKAEKDVEVGDFYFKRGNYRAAMGRYREAMEYKPNDAAATFGLASTLDRLGKVDEAVASYESYLKTLPHGPRAEEARKSLQRLKPKAQATQSSIQR
jgi:tetratricopeptide (TPR) repeat protein